MSSICILTPVIIGNWPVIQTAIAGAIAAMGFTLTSAGSSTARGSTRRVEHTVPNSEVLQDHFAAGEKIVAIKDGLQVEFGRDHRGACTVCVSGEGYTDLQLQKIAQEISTKVVQQYTYHKVITELQAKQFSVQSEQVTADGTIKIHVRRNGS